MREQALDTYIQKLQRELGTGIAREHAYRPALKDLLETLGDFHAVNDAAHIKDVGAPDFILLRDRLRVGFVEAKDVGENLDKVEKSDQMKRYKDALHNLVLTDYIEFRWYHRGEKQATATLGRLHQHKLTIDPKGVQDTLGLLNQFAAKTVPTIRNAAELADIMAGMTREIARLIETRLPNSPALQREKEAFEKTLIPNLNDRQFADMYAQTLAYGLFAARVGYRGKREDFVLEKAFWNLPQTNPFLTKFFQHIAPNLEEKVRWMVDNLAEVLGAADTDSILEGFGRKTRQEDPIVHFYETFLAKYDPTQRERRGVYYTPEPVVSYIVRSVDHLLREKFGRYDGLADKQVHVLDPATGTGTFLYFVIRQIFEWQVEQQGQGGSWGKYVQENLLPRLFGFELLMAPYAVAHMKLGIQLDELMQRTSPPDANGRTSPPGPLSTKQRGGVQPFSAGGEGFGMRSNQRLGVYLTNTLEELDHNKTIPLPLAEFISEEGEQAADVKRKKPIMVVLGNPPYSGHSSNTGQWISDLVRDYYKVDGQPLGERNPKWLQDDYVKFIRFGQWRIQQTGEGVLAFVTNHGYLDNPTFRGMRQQLLHEFSDIYILNLHGNSKKKEKAPDGSKDENVFDIQQGVAIGIFIKRPHPPAPSPKTERGSGMADLSHSTKNREGEQDFEKRYLTDAAWWEVLKPLARQMRHEPTLAEDALWQEIRNRRIKNAKFRRQHSVDRFIVDFYCAEARLIVEVDGPIHDYTVEQDAVRQAFLEAQGYRVLRFTNDQVLTELPGVLEVIAEALSQPHNPHPQSQMEEPHPQPLSTRGEGSRDGISSPSLFLERGLGGEVARVHYVDVWGVREDKYAALLENDLTTTNWQALQPQAPFYLFVPQNVDLRGEYEAGWSVQDIFPQNNMGITSGDDSRFVSYTDEEMRKRFATLGKVVSVDYRPFDVRKLYYDGTQLARARVEFMRHLSHLGNLALCTLRRPRNQNVENFFVTRTYTDKCIISSLDNAQVFPLYLYADSERLQLFDESEWALDSRGRRPNLSKAFVEEMEERLGLRFEPHLSVVTQGLHLSALKQEPHPPAPSPKNREGEVFGPEDVFYYAYAVFHSPTYRERYAEFLKIDFPRLPLTSDVALFRALVGHGARLVKLHLLDRAAVGKLITRYPVSGDDGVAKGYPKFVPTPNPSPPSGEGNEGRVYINPTQYFDGVPTDVWNFYVGGYQVLEKWLKDRRGRTLSSDDITHYQQVVAALKQTIEVMQGIDEAIPGWPLT